MHSEFKCGCLFLSFFSLLFFIVLFFLMSVSQPFVNSVQFYSYLLICNNSSSSQTTVRYFRTTKRSNFDIKFLCTIILFHKICHFLYNTHTIQVMAIHYHYHCSVYYYLVFKGKVYIEHKAAIVNQSKLSHIYVLFN